MASTALALHRPQLTAGHMTEFRKRAESLLSKARAVREKGESYIETGIRTTEIGATAFGVGVLQGKYGGVEIVGVPVELAAAVLGHLGGFLEIAGKHSWHLHNVADGALAAYLTQIGRGTGIAWKDKAGKGKDKTAGEDADGKRGATISEERLADLGKRR